VLRPWPADDGALVRLRVPGGRTTRAQLSALLAVAEEYGDGRVHLTARANLQLRGLPGGGSRPGSTSSHRSGGLPAEVVDAITATGLLPHPAHELVRNIMVSPLTGLLGGRADLQPVVAALDAGLVAYPSLTRLPGRFLFVLDDGRGDLLDRSLDLGCVAVSDDEVQLRLGASHWGPVVPISEAAARLVGLARAFVQVRGTGPDAPWHVDELPVTPDGQPRDPRTEVTAAPPPYGVLADGLSHVAIPDGVLDRTALEALPFEDLVITPWRSLVVGLDTGAGRPTRPADA
jgi:precorrin-3B synthase